MSALNEPKQIQQGAKGIISGQLAATKKDPIPTRILKPRTNRWWVAGSYSSAAAAPPAEEVDFKALSVAIRAWEMVVTAGIRNERITPIAPKRIAPTTKVPSPQPGIRLPAEEW